MRTVEIAYEMIQENEDERIELKYGCNPNQKPSRIYMADGSELPIKVLMRTDRDISISWMRLMDGSW